MKELHLSIRKLYQYVFKRKFIVGILFLFGIIYLLSRLYALTDLPIFTDEGIYIRWSQIARWDANWRFISLTDGKNPSYVWMAMNFMRVTDDPLLAGRLVSVLSGLFLLYGMFFLGRELFKNTWVGVASSFLYLVFPMALVYDRMALYESLTGMFVVWGFYFIILLIRHVRLDIALLLGFILGGGVLTKSNAFFNIYLLPFTLLIFDFKGKDWLVRLFRYIGLLLVAVVMAYGFYALQRLSPFYHIIEEKNTIFVYPFSEWIQHPLRFLVGNLNGQLDWLLRYMTWPVAVLVLASFLITRKQWREKIMLFIWFAAPFVALALFGKTLYPRYIFFMTLPLLLLAAFTLTHIRQHIKNSILYGMIVFAFLAGSLRSDFYILNDIAHAPIPGADLEQYINGWPSGGGLKEVITYLDEQSKTQKIHVASLGDFGSLPKYTVEIYLGDNKNVLRRDPGVYPIPPEIPEDILEKSKEMPTYVLSSNQPEFDQAIQQWPLKKIIEYRKGIGDTYTRLYVVTPQ